MCRVYSLQPIEGYRPPILSGHKDALVGVFFAGSRAASSAELDGRVAPDLLTVSRDGALFMWSFEADTTAAAATAAAELESEPGSISGEQNGPTAEGAEAEFDRPVKRRRIEQARHGKKYSGIPCDPLNIAIAHKRTAPV